MKKGSSFLDRSILICVEVDRVGKIEFSSLSFLFFSSMVKLVDFHLLLSLFPFFFLTYFDQTYVILTRLAVDLCLC